MSNKIIFSAISAVLAATIGMPAVAATQNMKSMDQTMTEMLGGNGIEKCYGIAKAGQNDCATVRHGCAGESTVDGDKASWIAVPNGLCQKILGGSMQESQPKKDAAKVS